MYDPWGKGYGGLPERKDNGKIMRNRQQLNDKFKVTVNCRISTKIMRVRFSKYNFRFNKQNEHSWDSTDGVPQNENLNPKKKTTLAKNTCGRELKIL
jgi:hypothetical protein